MNFPIVIIGFLFFINIFGLSEPSNYEIHSAAKILYTARNFPLKKNLISGHLSKPTVLGQQVTGRVASIPDCPDWVDWFEFKNLSITHTAPMDEMMEPTDYPTCFRRCSQRPSCTSFTFDFGGSPGSCKLFNVVTSSNVQESPMTSITMKLYPVAMVLGEWLVTRDVRPVGSFFSQQNATNHIHCLGICGSENFLKFCSAAIFNLDSKTCFLYNGYASNLNWRVEGRTIAFAHVSTFVQKSFFRFQELGQIYPKNFEPTLTFTAVNIEACLDSCVMAAANQVECQLVTTRSMGLSLSVDCQIFEYLPPTFETDNNSSSGSIHSFYLNVGKWNSRHKILPPFFKINGEPLETIQGHSLEECHLAAENNLNASYYTFNSSSALCVLFGGAVSFEIWKFEKNFKTFSKSASTHSPNFYAFESFWASSIPSTHIDLHGDCDLDNYLGQCLDDPNCFGVAINQLGGYCAVLSEIEMTQIMTQVTTPPSTMQFQIFKKVNDLRYLQELDRVKCLQNTWLTSNDLDVGPSFEDLVEFREKLPKDGKPPMAPHGVDFVCPNKIFKDPPAAPVVMETGEKVRVSSLLGQGERRGKSGFGPIIDVIKFGPEFGGHFLSDGVIIPEGSLADIKSPKNFGGAPVIVHRGRQACDTSCPIPNGKEDVGIQFLSRKLFPGVISKGDPCKCTGRPRMTSPATSIFRQDEPYLQERCDGRAIKEECGLCCRVGYQVSRPSICTCDTSPAAYWNRNAAHCLQRSNCGITDSELGGSTMGMWKLKIQNCLNVTYFGVNFLPDRKLPFYTIYKFRAENAIDRISNKLDHPRLAQWRPDWVTFPCTERGLYGLQMSKRDYDGIGGFLKWNRGQLAPNVDFRFLRDAATATHQYINAAPQDAYSSGQWTILEGYIRDILMAKIPSGDLRLGHIITGICLPQSWDTMIPDCFWKMVCTQTDTGEVVVGTFFHFNIESSHQQDYQRREERRHEIFQIRHQNYLKSPWIGLDPERIWDDAKSLVDHPGLTYDRCKEASNGGFPPLRQRVESSDDDIGTFLNQNENFVIKNGGELESPKMVKGSTQNLEEKDEPIFENESKSPPNCPKKVVGFVTNWGSMPFTEDQGSYLIHAIFAYIRLTSDGRLLVGGPFANSLSTNKTILRLEEMKFAKKMSQNRLKIMFSVGGWENSQFFSTITATHGLTKNFLRSMLTILDEFGLDGLDIDWKYPVKNGRQPGLSTDKVNFVIFLNKVRKCLDAHQIQKGRNMKYLLTISVPAFPLLLAGNYDLAKLLIVVDWLNIVTLDYFGPWADPKVGQQTGPISPLYFGAPLGLSGKHNVDYTFKYLFCRLGHNNMNKLVMTIGFYGRFWNHSGPGNGNGPLVSNGIDSLWRTAKLNSDGQVDGGFLPWSAIYDEFLQSSQYFRRFDTKTRTPYLTSVNGNFLLAYEDPKSVSEKVAYVAAKGLGGVSLWAIDFDDPIITLTRTAASSSSLCGRRGEILKIQRQFQCPQINEKKWWTMEDSGNALKCGKWGPLINGFYPRCDPYDPGYGCCSKNGVCGSGPEFCECEGCIDYYRDPKMIWEPPVKPCVHQVEG